MRALGLLVMVAAVSIGSIAHADPSAPELQAQGEELAKTGHFSEAIDAFKIALWSTESAEAHAALGEAYRQSQDPVTARAEAERALALDPASVEARQLLARLEGR